MAASPSTMIGLIVSQVFSQHCKRIFEPICKSAGLSWIVVLLTTSTTVRQAPRSSL